MEPPGVKTYDELIRVSSMGERGETDESTRTIEDQKRANRDAVKELGGRIGKTIKMLDESGFTVLPRIQQEVVERVRSGKSNGIVIAYSDRLARNWWDAGAFFTAMAAVDAEVIDATAPLTDYRSDEGRTLWGTKMVMNELPSLAAKRRSNRIADDLVARGIPNRVPFGYRRNGSFILEGGRPVCIAKVDPDRDAKALVPDDVLDKHGKVVGGTAQTVRRIFAMRYDGYALSAIAKTLNDAGLPSPNGKQWAHSSLTTMFRNIAYTGVVRLGKRRIEGAHVALVSKQQWQAVQSTRPVVRNGSLVAGIAGGLLECSGCGKPLSMIGSNHGRPSYGCRRESGDGACPRPVYISAATCNAFVHDAVRGVLDEGSLGLVSSARELERARAAYERAREESQAFVKLSSAIDVEHFQAGYADRRDREAAAAQVYDELLAHASEVDEMPTTGAGYDALDLTHQRRIARSLIERIVVSPPAPRTERGPIEDRLALDWKRSR
jgi:hypothetical protein